MEITTNGFTIPFNTIKGFHQILGRIPSYYHGISIRLDENENYAVIMSTNGKILLSMKYDIEDIVAPKKIFLPYVVTHNIVYANPGKHGKVKFTNTEGDEWMCEVIGLDKYDDVIDVTKFLFTNESRNIPWRRNFPCEVDGVPSQFNPNLIMTIQKAVATILGVSSKEALINIHHNGKNASPVTCPGNPGIYGIIMPLNDDKEVDNKWERPSHI